MLHANLPQRSTQRRLLVLLAAPILLMTACGGSDSDSSDEPDDTTATVEAADSEASPAAADDATEAGDATGSPIEVGDDGTLELSDDVNDVIGAIGVEQMMNIVADQLDPKPTVSIDGSNVTFTFSEGQVDSNAWLPCATGGAFLEDGQTLTVVYPDGEQEC